MELCDKCVRKATNFCNTCITDGKWKARPSNFLEGKEILIKNLNYEETPNDPIKPNHYHKNEIDVHGYLQKHFPKEGEYTVAEGFHIGNVIKYVSRYKNKNGLEDLKKAEANLKILIELEESK